MYFINHGLLRAELFSSHSYRLSNRFRWILLILLEDLSKIMSVKGTFGNELYASDWGVHCNAGRSGTQFQLC